MMSYHQCAVRTAVQLYSMCLAWYPMGAVQLQGLALLTLYLPEENFKSGPKRVNQSVQ
jgi:hypothetical protein